ncbi:hypothetical protein EBR96_03170, partial [bacterium]|nr:hypothetical protein [bacterium]
ERTISLLPPEKVSATLSISQLADLPNPQTSITQPESPLRYLAVSVALKNNSRLPIESISVTMDGSKCVVPAWFEVPTKTISSLAPGKTETLKWVFRQISPEAGSLDAAVSAFGTFQNTLHAAIPAVLSQNTVSVESSHRQLKVGEYGYLTIRAGTPGSTVSCIGNVSGNAIEFIRNTPDTWLSPALFAAHINLGPDGFRINELPIPKDRSGSVLRWHFRAATTGITQITCGDNGIPNTLQIEVIP